MQNIQHQCDVYHWGNVRMQMDKHSVFNQDEMRQKGNRIESNTNTTRTRPKPDQQKKVSVLYSINHHRYIPTILQTATDFNPLFALLSTNVGY